MECPTCEAPMDIEDVRVSRATVVAGSIVDEQYEEMYWCEVCEEGYDILDFSD